VFYHGHVPEMRPGQLFYLPQISLYCPVCNELPFHVSTNIIINNTMLHKQCPKGGCLE